MRRRRYAAMIATLVTFSVIAGCSADDTSDTTATTTTPTTEAAPETTAAPVDEAAQAAAAMTAVEDFFGAYGTGDFDRAEQLLQNGAALRPTFQGLYDSFNVAASALSADAKSATFTSPDQGEVIY